MMNAPLPSTMLRPRISLFRTLLLAVAFLAMPLSVRATCGNSEDIPKNTGSEGKPQPTPKPPPTPKPQPKQP